MQNLSNLLIPQGIALRQQYLKNSTNYSQSQEFLKTLALINEIDIKCFKLPNEFPKQLTQGSIYKQNGLRISIFFMPKDSKMRLHDHPQMYVMCKLLKGKLLRTQYILQEKRYQSQIPKLYVSSLETENQQIEFPKVVAIKSSEVLNVGDIDIVNPEVNIHTFTAYQDSIFFDIICPDYDDINIFMNTYIEAGQLDNHKVELQMCAPVLEDNITLPIDLI